MPIPTLRECLIKGNPDPVSNGLAILKKAIICCDNPRVSDLLFKLANFQLSEDPDYEMLIQSPQSINTIKPPNQANLLRRFTHNYLSMNPIVKNPQLKAMLKLSDISAQHLIQWLM